MLCCAVLCCAVPCCPVPCTAVLQRDVFQSSTLSSILGCSPGYADCDGQPTNGCEINTQTDSSHCGGCNTACQLDHATPACQQGSCVVGSCETGEWYAPARG